MNFFEGLFLVCLEALLPNSIKVLHVFLSDFYVLAHLILLYICAKYILELDDFTFQKSYLLHQVFIKLVLVHFAAFQSKQLHLLLYKRKN